MTGAALPPSLRTAELAHRRAQSGGCPADSIAWALGQLEEGTDATSVTQLASFGLEADPEPHAVEGALAACLTELGIELHDDDEYAALLGLASDIATRLIDGDLDTRDGLRRLLELLEDYEAWRVSVWDDLAEDIHALESAKPGHLFVNEGLTRANVDACIVSIAREFVFWLGRRLPRQFPRVRLCPSCRNVAPLGNWHDRVKLADCAACGAIDAAINMLHAECRATAFASDESMAALEAAYHDSAGI